MWRNLSIFPVTAHVIFPTANSVYYVYALGYCNTTSCVKDSIVVIPIPTNPTLANSNIDTIFLGQSSTLTVYGNLSSGEIFKWYNSACGTGNYEGSGNQLTVTPVSTTIYYVRKENNICYSNCLFDHNYNSW